MLPYMPNIYDDSQRDGRYVSPYTKLFEDRIVFLNAPIDDSTANDMIAQLLALDNMDPDRPITIYVNSPGGSMSGLSAVVDTMEFLACDVSTYCIGQALGAAAVLFAAGTHGMRHMLPNAKIMLHQPAMGSSWGKATEIEIQAREMEKMRTWIDDKLAAYTGQSSEKIHKDLENDLFLDASEAIDYGIADSIVQKKTRTKHDNLMD